MQESRSYSTFAVSVWFDEFSSKALKGAVHSVSELTGNAFLLENEAPPHITLGMFHVCPEDEKNLSELFSDFCEKCKKIASQPDLDIKEKISKLQNNSLDLELSGTDTFSDKVIFFKLAENSSGTQKLLQMNRTLHEIFLTHFEAGNSKKYLPENWMPHIALAVKLSAKEFERWNVKKKKVVFCSDEKLRGLNARGIGTVSGAKTRVSVVEGESRSRGKPGLADARLAQEKNKEKIEQKEILVPKRLRLGGLSLAKTHPYTEVRREALQVGAVTAARHKNMAAIRSTGNSLETSLRSALFRFGFRFRKNDRRLAGSPDIVFPHYHAVIFVNGCFWHAHGWNGERSIISNYAHGANATDEQGWNGERSERSMPFVSAAESLAPSEHDSAFSKAFPPPSILEKYSFLSFYAQSASCKKFRFPRTNAQFWYEKFSRNRARDLRDIAILLDQGWRVAVVWECAITGKKRAEKVFDTASRISFWLEERFDERFCEF